MTKEENVIRYYVLCNKLKNVIRTGWKDWNVQRDRVESVAEHVYSVQMLAIAMYSEYRYDNVDIFKVILMLAVHELEEIFIGDLTLFQITKEEKKKLGHEAVEKVLSGLLIKEEIIDIIKEFDEEKTPEAIFAHYCDKLECDLQSRLYDEEKCVDINNQPNNLSIKEAKLSVNLDNMLNRLSEEYNITYEKARNNYELNISNKFYFQLFTHSFCKSLKRF